MNGTTSREYFRPKNTRLTKIEEEVLIRDILQLDSQGLSPSLELVRDMASTICKARGSQGVGTRWPYSFVQRTPELQMKFTRTYECRRKLSEDPKMITAWFNLLRNMIISRGIQPEDIWNYDETGF